MPRYAQIDNHTSKCICVSILAGEVEAEYMIPLNDEADVQPDDVYKDGEWIRPEPKPLYEPGPTKAERLTALETENELLKAQNQALSGRADFIEDIVAEMALKIY